MFDLQYLGRVFILDFVGATLLMYGLAWLFGLSNPWVWAIVVGIISAVQALTRRHLRNRRSGERPGSVPAQ